MDDKKSMLPTFLHWFSWTISVGASILFLISLVGEDIPEMLKGQAKELLAYLPFLLMAIAGSFTAFFKQKLGAILMLIGGIGIIIVLFLQGGSALFGMMVVYGLPYIFPGSILLFIRK